MNVVFLLARPKRSTSVSCDCIISVKAETEQEKKTTGIIQKLFEGLVKDANTPPAASGSEVGERSAAPGDKETAAQPEAPDPEAENAETPVAEQAVASSSAGAEAVIRGEGTSTEPTEEITGSAQEIPSSQVAGAQGWIY
ncbi:hypothetical protein SKAU_G00233850 [Synaphobranchus kaupii]|uniref:Uncharacterized protein n=1 Tax=Synaphobranchus kaupii TaxID=118154 RepID=A0A9Q1ITJ0_SYNKA|nr:hypothetical protein SKAU_G00233850 [Synaphobranchus kaupii]